MKGKIDGNLSPNKNIYIFSGHDKTIASVTRAIEIYDQISEFPDFGATLAFELHQRIDLKGHEIKVIPKKISFYDRKRI